jgi:hypothetical protein
LASFDERRITMYQAVNERNDERTEMFWSEEELEEYLNRVSQPGDFWDVLVNGRIEYYWSL